VAAVCQSNTGPIRSDTRDPSAGAGTPVAYLERTGTPASGSRLPVFVIDDQDVWSAMVRWQRNFYP
jgi:hypothetical protein